MINNKYKVTCFGIGNLSNSIIAHIKEEYHDLTTISLNLDKVSLNKSVCDYKLNIDTENEKLKINYQLIEPILKNTNYALLFFNLAANSSFDIIPELLNELKKKDIITFVFAIKPFDFEGEIKKIESIKNLEKVNDKCDNLFVLSSEKILFNQEENYISKALANINNVVDDFIKCIRNLTYENNENGFNMNQFNLSLQKAGISYFNYLSLTKNEFIETGYYLIYSSKYLDYSIKKAKKIFINFRLRDELKVKEITNFLEKIKVIVSTDCDINFSYCKDENQSHDILISILANNYTNDILTNDEQILSRVDLNKFRVNSDLDKKETDDIQDNIIPSYLKKIRGNK